ncbi:hypothetical protein APB26_32735 [Pseudomonas aeruginosa]|nr:hypothetical protein APB26_32735 [Pseudomonas aeruginosa]RPV61423.1 hypothetical protein IPC838_19075 [Pseudomonas aeruginosa]
MTESNRGQLGAGACNSEEELMLKLGGLPDHIVLAMHRRAARTHTRMMLARLARVLLVAAIAGGMLYGAPQLLAAFR